MSNTLLPLYNSILQYKNKSNDNRGVDEIIAQLDQDYGGNRHAYLKFLLFPDIYAPCRPPMLFPYPTHMFRDLGSLNLTASGGGLYFAWVPFLRSGSSLTNSIAYWTGSSTIGAVTDIATTVTGETALLQPVPTVTGIDADHVRGIAAYLTITYVGRLDELAGVVEIGVMVDDSISQAADLRYLTTAQLKACYQYKRQDVSEGIRCIWLPLRDADLEPYGANGTTGPKGVSTAYIIHINGAPATAGAFRVDYGYYYDGIVDETGFHTLMPVKPSKNQPSNSELTNVIRQQSEDFAVTKSITDNSFASNLYNNIKDSFSAGINQFGKVVTGNAIDMFLGNPMGYIK